jgi:signal transduction histidine kinase
MPPLDVTPACAISASATSEGGAPKEKPLLLHSADDAHIVQFYEDEAFLADAAADFLEAGLRDSEPLIVVAVEGHRALFAQRLASRGVDVGGLCASGHLQMLDATDLLDRLMLDGMPDRVRFHQVVGAAVASATRRSPGGRVRVYGEMVDLLWRAGNSQAAAGLEDLWNQIRREYSLSLLCSYQMSNFRDGHDGDGFEQICGSHSRVLPTERYLSLDDYDSRLREVSILQQRAQALSSEIERRKAAEAALREALKVRDDFLSLAGHELLTPLTVLRLQLASLLANGRSSGDGGTKRRLAILAAQTDRLTSLASRLLDVSQLGDAVILAPIELDLVSLVRDSIDSFSDIAAAAGTDVTLVGETGMEGGLEGMVIGRWDRDRIQQVMQDLLSNALKFGAGKPVQITVTKRRDWAEIAIRDGGAGIALADQARIFDRFDRRSPTESVAGLGLGLWVAKRVVQAHGGTIGLESQLGRGATFTIRLPYDPPADAVAEPTSSVSHEPSEPDAAPASTM